MILRFLNFTPMLLIIISLYVFTPLISNYYYYRDYYLGKQHLENEVFDFIVIGSGSAGAVVANRLSKNNKVLLLEAGGNPLPFSSIPIVANEIMHMPQASWNYKTVPQKFSMQGFNDKVSLWPRGKSLGGTSNLNFMLYVRGNPHDYDNWANLTEDDGWRYENFLHYFKKSLDYQGEHYENERHYKESPNYGELHVQKQGYDAPLHSYFIQAVKEFGYAEVDTNGPQKVGFGRTEVTQKDGRRFGTFKAFLEGQEGRRNLFISRYSHATKIKLDRNKRAVGVWYLRHGKKYFAKVSKEVIVSAGAVDSPKLLMLSGIGKKEDLEALNIKSTINLSGVGKNLKDHIAIVITPFVINQPLSLIAPRDLTASEVYDYFKNGRGLLTAPSVLNTHGFVPSSHAPRKDWPDLQLYLTGVGVYSESAEDYTRMLGYNKSLFAKYFRPLQAQEMDAFALMVTLVLPKSVGEIRLRDKNPFTEPIIDPHYLEDPQDVKALVEGIKLAVKMGEETKSFKTLNSKLFDLPLPPEMGCGHVEIRSDEYWECLIRHFAFTLYHPVGTCRMGKEQGDPGAVVNSQLRVLQSVNIRVADASIMPEIVNGNTNAPCIAIGEKAADLIRQYWSQQYLISQHKTYLFDRKSFTSRCYYSKHV